MVDQERRGARVRDLPQAASELLALVAVEARRGLVETEQARLHGDRPRDPDELPLTLGQLARHRLREHPDREEVERGVGRGRIAGGTTDELGGEGEPGGALGRDHEVLAHREIVEQLRALPGAGEPATGACVRRHTREIVSVELGTAGVPHETRDRVDEGRLAGSVRPDQPDQLTLLDDDVDLVDGAHAAETHGQAGRREDGRHEPLAGVEAGTSAFCFARACAVR